MIVNHLKTIVKGDTHLNRVTSACWSPNNLKLAVAFDNIVTLYDETGDKKDRFPTKSIDPNHPHSIISLSFSPDSTKLAIAQSDNSLFIYKLGSEWGEKKSICNKFIQTSGILCLCWPESQINSVIFGLADGKERNLKTNKAATLYQVESPAISICINTKGTAIASGKIVTHPTTPHLIGWALESLIVIGADSVFTSYKLDGKMNQRIKPPQDSDIDYSILNVSSNGLTVVLGSFNRLNVFNYNIAIRKWEESNPKLMDNMYTITSIAWKNDGSRLVLGNSTGWVEMFDTCIKRCRYKGKFELTYTSTSQVIVKRISNGSRVILKSHFGYSINKIDIFKDQYLIAHTEETLLLADMNSFKLSEIQWKAGRSERFYFDFENIVMVFAVGELSIIEYGLNEVIGTCRTEHTNPHSISIRLNESTKKDSKRILAYLLDHQTIQVMDLVSGISAATINHDCKVDWLELSTYANKLLYRDKRFQVYLFDLVTQTRICLLNYCNYVQWVPNSDVVVAQNQSKLCVWYFCDSPEKVVVIPIKGDVETIERSQGQTFVIINEAMSMKSIQLDEILIEFGSSFDNKDYIRAINLLESLEWSEQVETMWSKLGKLALQDGNLLMTERCFAETGDISSASFLRQIYINSPDDTDFSNDGHYSYAAKAKLAILNGDFKEAESIYLQHGQIDEALTMYQDLHKWDMAIRVAELKHHPDLDQIKETYHAWLVNSGQQDILGQIKEEEGEYDAALKLFIDASIPGKAAQLIQKYNLCNDINRVSTVANSLFQTKLYEKAGDLYSLIKNQQKAYEAYLAGNCFRKAIDICRTLYPEQVIIIEEKWGDYLLEQNKVEQAINHFIESGKVVKALQAAMSGRLYTKAASIIDSLSNKTQVISQTHEIAISFKENRDYKQAEKYFLLSNSPKEAIDMFISIQDWDQALRLSQIHLSTTQQIDLFIEKGKDLERQGELKESEKIYLIIQKPDLAISMYKNNSRYPDMIRLCSQFYPEKMNEMYSNLAQLVQERGNFSLAEEYYIACKDWKSAVKMHCSNGNFELAFKVAKSQGGLIPSSHVALLWAKTLNPETAIKILNKLGLLDQVIELASESSLFDLAFSLASGSDKTRINELHFKYAMHLEDEGKIHEAETSYIKASRAKEAILMHVHNENWERALNVAEKHDRECVAEVLYSEAKSCFEKKNYERMEMVLLRSPRPDLAIRFYREGGMINEAILFAEKHCPAKVAELRDLEGGNTKGKLNISQMHAVAKRFEFERNYEGAISTFIKMVPSSSNENEVVFGSWIKAVELANKFLSIAHSQKTTSVVASQFYKFNQFETAGDLFLNIGSQKEAVDSFIKAKSWDKARRAAANKGVYLELIEAAYIQHLNYTGDTKKLLKVDPGAGLESLFRQGEWDACLESAKQQSDAILWKYGMDILNEYIKKKAWIKCIEMIIKHGAIDPNVSGMIYELVFQSCSNCLNETGPSTITKYKQATTIMSTSSPLYYEKYKKYFEVIHFLNQRNELSSLDKTMKKKLSLNLLRFVDVIDVEKIFYICGKDLKVISNTFYKKECKEDGTAFSIWNMFLDICDAIEEGDLEELQHSIHLSKLKLGTRFKIPLELIPEQLRENVRDWVLQKSLEKKGETKLDYYSCVKCSSSVFVGMNECWNCSYEHDFCVVTGSILELSFSQCTSCKRKANTSDWMTFVSRFKKCAWCCKPQNIVV